MKLNRRASSLLVVIAFLQAGLVQGGVSADEAAQLGTSLTAFGAEKAGNASGTIPAYSGGLPTNTTPPGFKPGSGRWTNPYPDEKPLFTVNAENLERYRDALSETGKEMFKRYPNYRMDVYPSHRSVAYPAWVLENTRKNATSARLIKDGVALDGAYGGIPFPIPKTGNEVLWNHLLINTGVAYDAYATLWSVDGSGRSVKWAGHFTFQNSYYDPASSAEEHKKNGSFYHQHVYNWSVPAGSSGFAVLDTQTLDPTVEPRRIWDYDPATRRVREVTGLPPDLGLGSLGSLVTFDQDNLFTGPLDQFDFKLLGKREMLIPYNTHALFFETPAERILTPGHLNPDFVRWEWHRVWVVEATIRPGKKNQHHKKVFYLDEDWSGAGMSDEYDATGKLVRGLFRPGMPLYDVQVQIPRCYWVYDLEKNMYALDQHFGDPGLSFQPRQQALPKLNLKPDALARRGVF
ncbi:MAG: DUF1329 domain-containing protein [Candidatus Accumulibacter sp.]|uniref:DUF1329 domain-containing protein n=1 Tax=Accumulibacter sp. TaxID=2053492 RepID=UPI002879D58E|nr:DUF1329 domain-containing protein [Accumulibacter sp.]MDS4013357.1 DUF1329 domain-containing protein [Accumulibacter sp.]